MAYKVVPFNAQVQPEQAAEQAAEQLEQLVNHYEAYDWSFRGLEEINTLVVIPGEPGNAGCFGIGAVPARPEQRVNVTSYVAVFHHP